MGEYSDDWEESTSEDEEVSEPWEEENDGMPAVKSMALCMWCIFQGYASMVGPLQSALKSELNASEHGSCRAHAFTQAAVGVHYGKFIARLGQNLLVCISPYKRVVLSMVMVFIGVLVPPLFVFTFGSQWIGNVFVSYLLAGIGLGIFEVTFLSVITPMGKETKSWAIVGAPAGFFTVNVCGLMLRPFGVPAECLYWWIVACVPVGIYVFIKNAPKDGALEKESKASIVKSCSEANQWVPVMIPFFIAQFFSHFAMENWPAIFYMYPPDDVPLYGPQDNDHLMKWGPFFAIAYIFVFLGDAPSRKLAFKLNLTRKRWNYLFLLGSVVLIVSGLMLESLAIAIIVPFAIFLIFWGNGTIYGLTSKYIDMFVPFEHNLAAYSFWATIGDCGAILGGTMVDYTHALFCSPAHVGLYECVQSVHNSTMVNGTTCF